MEQWIQDAFSQYSAVINKHFDMTELELKLLFQKEGWDTNTLRKAGQVAEYRVQIMLDKQTSV